MGAYRLSVCVGPRGVGDRDGHTSGLELQGMALCGRSRFIMIVCGYVICLGVHVRVSFLGSLCVGVVPVCACVGIYACMPMCVTPGLCMSV